MGGDEDATIAGFSGLGDRYAEYYNLGCRFA